MRNKKKFPFWVVSTLVLLVVAPELTKASQSDVLLVQPEIENFCVVSENIWRGAAPSDSAIDHLSRQGIKTVIDLRQHGFSCQHEEALVSKLGMKYVHIPMGFSKPSTRQIVSFLRLVNNRNNHPIFVHCRQGADRTGVQIALYRILMQHWSFQKAYGEMCQHHFKPWLAGMKNTVAELALDAEKQDKLISLVNLPDDKQALDIADAITQ